MFALPVDAWYIWVGVALASVLVLGLVSAFPTAPPPDAAGVAETVDTVASDSYPATATHAVAADRVSVHPECVRLRGEGGTARATFAFGPVTPATDGRLRRVLDGVPPDEAFDDPEALRQAAIEAGTREPQWIATDGTVRVRQVHWRSVRVTLVG